MEEITGYDITETGETKETFEEKRELLKCVMKDIQWRSNNQTLHTKEEYQNNDTVQSLKVEQYDKEILENSREKIQKENEFNMNNNLNEYFKGTTSLVFVNKFREKPNDGNGNLNGQNEQINQNTQINPNRNNQLLQQSLINHKPSPSQIENFYNLIDQNCDVSFINKSSLSKEYKNMINSNLQYNYHLSNTKQQKCTDVSQLPIYANMNQTTFKALNMLFENQNKLFYIPQIPIETLMDWVVDCEEETFLQRRYQFLCSIEQMKISDPIELVFSSLDKSHLTRRCILFSDLAEMKLLDLQTLFSRLSLTHHENSSILIRNIFSTNHYVITRQNYLMNTIIESELETNEENQSDDDNKEGKKKGRKKASKKKGKKQVKKAKDLEKEKTQEREKRLKEFGINEEEMKDVELVEYCRKNQLETFNFIRNLYKSNNKNISNYITKTVPMFGNESTGINESTSESELTGDNSEKSENENSSSSSQSNVNELITLVDDLLEKNDWYHFVLIVIELLHPAIIKKAIIESEMILEKLIQHISYIYYHPKIMSIINCCYSIIKSTVPHVTLSIKRKAILFLTLLLDYIQRPNGNLLKIKEYLENTMKQMNEMKYEKVLLLSDFTNEEYEVKLKQNGDEKIQVKYVLNTLINLLYDKNVEHFKSFFTFAVEMFPTYPIAYLFCKQMNSTIILTETIELKVISLIKNNILPISTFIKHYIQPTLKQTMKMNDNEKIFICMKIISKLMEVTNENDEKIWNIRISEMVFDQVIESLNILKQEQINQLFPQSYGGDINEFMFIHKEKVFKMLKDKEKGKIISGLFWKPNTFYNKNEIELKYIEEHQCNLSSISLLFSIITVEKGVELFLHVMLSQVYSLNEIKVLINEINDDIFQSELFSQKMINILNSISQRENETSFKSIDSFIANSLEEWCNEHIEDDEDKITCDICVSTGLFYSLVILFKNISSVELIDAFIRFISLPQFSKDDTETITSLITTICEKKVNQMEIEEVSNNDNEENELKRNRLLIKGITVYLMKFNNQTETTDLSLIDSLLIPLNMVVNDSLNYSNGKQVIIEFDQSLKENNCPLSFMNYIYSQLPLIDEILNEKDDENDIDIHYYPKQQSTYSNLLFDSKVIEFDPQFD